jgi:ankyrin repeat protein
LREKAKRIGRVNAIAKEAQKEFLGLYKDLSADKAQITSLLYTHIERSLNEKTPVDLAKVKFWLHRGADVNAVKRNDEENKILKNSILLNNLGLIKLIVEDGKANPSGTLFLAVSTGNIDIVKYLMEKGAKATERSKTDFGDLPPLFEASFKNDLPIMDLLFANGAATDINLKDSEKETPLMWAIRGAGDEPKSEALKVLDLLLKNGADPNIRNQNLYSPLSVVTKLKGDSAREMENLLKKNGAKM